MDGFFDGEPQAKGGSIMLANMEDPFVASSSLAHSKTFAERVCSVMQQCLQLV